MAGIVSKGCVYRIRKCAIDLISIMDLMDGEDSWDLMGRDLHLRCTFLYCDFNQMISKAPEVEKKSLIDLGNRLFESIEELNDAVELKNISLTESRYIDTAAVIEELLVQLPYCDTFLDDQPDL